MTLNIPQKAYAILGINELLFRGLIDDVIANSIISNLACDILKETDSFSDALIKKLEEEEQQKILKDD